MSDWWSRRLADSSPRPAQRQEAAPPVTPPTRFGVHVPVQAPAQQAQSGPQRVLDETRAPTDNISMGEAIRLWKGGEAARREGGVTCPACGSRNVFSRAKGTMVNNATPAPRCFECGWNGIYEQGEQSSWVV
jgi:DNA-directed RNA polymerase subunit RPC12/RpoP